MIHLTLIIYRKHNILIKVQHIGRNENVRLATYYQNMQAVVPLLACNRISIENT